VSPGDTTAGMVCWRAEAFELLREKSANSDPEPSPNTGPIVTSVYALRNEVSFV
jgi:hypothetical protein